MSKSLKKLSKTDISPSHNTALRLVNIAFRELFGAKDVILGGNVKILQISSTEFECSKGRKMYLVLDCTAMLPSSIQKVKNLMIAPASKGMVWKGTAEIRLEKNDAGHWLTQEVAVWAEPREKAEKEKFFFNSSMGDGKPIHHFPHAAYLCGEKLPKVSDYQGELPQLSSHL